MSQTLAPERYSEENLIRAWQTPPGFWGRMSAVNHKVIGLRFIVTGFVFFLVGGILALFIRTQLAIPENSFLSAEIYNQFFTMHGTTMMFLFAVPMLEGLAIYLMPLMLGTRDLPFPRLNSFGYWLYLFGGLFVFSSFITGQVPSEGWFAYVPLSGSFFSPDMGMDFWLLGITMVEITGVIGALELIVAFLRRRAPGMTLNRVPLFGWSILVMASMMAIAFPVLVTASSLLELERAAGLVFFDPNLGGDPLLWQHLFWFFGHPEVYIMLLPAAGMVSMIVPVFARRVVAGYGWVVGALVAIGIASFGLWVHHMFTVGLPSLAMAFFTAASVLIAIPSGVLVFSWLATLWQGKPVFKPPLLYVTGFLIIFVIGGITGVMVASVPFDWQVHDSFFVVAHFHYVLLGGVVFPTFAALYYWFPKFTGRMTSERLGRTGFWLAFTGVNLAFFPQHFLGLQGMPRRVFTYEVGLGWELGNLLSTIGAFVLAIGVAVAVVDFLKSRKSGPLAGSDPWQGSSLEWATTSPPPVYNFKLIPSVSAPDPMWGGLDNSEPPEWMVQLAHPEKAVREVVDTSPVEAIPEDIVALPGPSLWPLWSSLALVVALIGVLISEYTVAIVGGALFMGTLVGWAGSDPGDVRESVLDSAADRRSSIGVWGLWVGIVSLSAILGSLIVSHWYLSVVTEARGAVAEVEMIHTVLAAGLGVLAFVISTGARKVYRPGSQKVLVALLAVALVATGLALVGALAASTQMPVASESAQASIVVAIVGFGAVLAIGLAGGAVAAAIQTARRSSIRSAALQATQVYSGFLAVAWLAICGVLLMLPWVSGL